MRACVASGLATSEDPRRREDEIPQQPVDDHWVSHGRQMPGVLERDQLASGRLREFATLRERADQVASPWITSVGQRTRAQVSRNRSLSGEPQPARRVRQRLGRRLQRPADAVLDLLGRVRFGEALGEEELEEAEVVLHQ